MKTALALPLSFLVVLLTLGGCTERPQVVHFRQGDYQGKPDTPPYAATAFAGDAAKWSAALDRRTRRQNEHERIH